MDRQKYQYEGMKWLMELELLNHPQVINTIRFNILTASKRIKEVELLIYRENKSMLVLLELSWMGRKFFKKNIFLDVQDVLTQLLPSFRFRITDDPKIMQLAVERVKQALSGGTYDKVSNPSNDSSGVLTTDSASQEHSETIGVGTSTESSSEKQPESQPKLREEVSQDNSEKEQ